MAGNPDDTCNVESNKAEKVKDINIKWEEEKEMAPTSSNAMHKSSSRPQLDVSGAAIQGNFEERNPTILLPNQSDDISHLALDIGGSHHIHLFIAYVCPVLFVNCISSVYFPPFLQASFFGLSAGRVMCTVL